MELKCAVQNYAWGKIGSTSAVASLSSASNHDFVIDEESTYAELWMGTHPNGPSIIKSLNKSLSDYINENPSVLGKETLEKYNGELPFLFKILSVNKALSIQAHPDKKLAEKLHSERPDIYKDSNHKPEMAIALTKFEGLCGFRSYDEIKGFIQNIPQFKTVLDGEAVEKFIDNPSSELLKILFTSLMKCSQDKIIQNLKSWKDDLEKSASNDRNENCKELFLRLMSQYPNDVGCFVIYFLNHVKLSAGEAMFLGPNLPHAYLDGDCVECMACSDNVVRSGLTPKLIDVDTLCSMLNYVPSSNPKFEAKQRNKSILEYEAPVPDFSVAKITVEPGTKLDLNERSSASIIIITKGSCNEYKRGNVIFLPANQKIQFENSNSDEMVAFQAFC